MYFPATRCANPTGAFKLWIIFSMHVPEGSIYGFVGKNGAGKTTLIRLICGLQAPSSGEYQLYGHSHNDGQIALARRHMGAVVETPSIYGHLSATENLKEQYRVLGIPETNTIPALLDLVGLGDTGKKKAKKLFPWYASASGHRHCTGRQS